MKTILTLSILVLSICSFGQKLTDADIDQAAKEAIVKTDHQVLPKVTGVPTIAHKDKTLTAADSIVLPIAKFEPSVKTELDNFDAEITKLAKQYEDIIKAKNQTLKTFYIIYCDQKKIDPSRATVKLGKDGFIIQVLK